MNRHDGTSFPSMDTAGNMLFGVGVIYDKDSIRLLAHSGDCDGRTPLIMGGLPLRRDNLQNLSIWTPLSATSHLGFPLRYTGGIGSSIAIPGLQSADNEVLRLLSLDIDPYSTNLGQSHATARTDVNLSRADGETLDEEDAKAIEAFIRLELADVRALQDISRNDEKYAAARQRAVAAATRATPEIFEDFRKQYVKGPVCQTCGIPKGWREVALSSCSKCKATNYCSKECQVKDWKIHKVGKEHKGGA